MLEPQRTPAGVGGRLGRVPGDEYALHHPLDQGAQFVAVLRGVEQQDERRELPFVSFLAVFGLSAGRRSSPTEASPAPAASASASPLTSAVRRATSAWRSSRSWKRPTGTSKSGSSVSSATAGGLAFLVRGAGASLRDRRLLRHHPRADVRHSVLVAGCPVPPSVVALLCREAVAVDGLARGRDPQDDDVAETLALRGGAHDPEV
ncbi:hypothetical protein BN2537_16811 [Streptomyces venezuelae]|nr:hypothetical protein BN2537_16811 [Streptomyces venezuelae]